MRSKVCFDRLYDERKKTAQAVFFYALSKFFGSTVTDQFV